MILLKAKEYFPSLKDREKISAISLSLPTTRIGVTVDDLRACMKIMRIRSRVPAVIDAENLIF